MRFIEKIIQRLGKKDYYIDSSMSSYDVTCIMVQRVIPLLRGALLKLRLKESHGLIFLGRRTKILFPHKIRMGKTIIIEDYVEINALSMKGVTIGNNVTIKKNTIIECTGVIRELGVGLRIGNNVGISQGAFIQVRGEIIIGSHVMFGPHVSIFSENHDIINTDKLLLEQPSIRKGVVIEDNVWIGANSTILDGVRIGEGSVVAAGSVVSKDVPSYTVVAGIPAVVIKNRKKE
jgi:acetyltransferase-like isoleucine patch superfamily enzyme